MNKNVIDAMNSIDSINRLQDEAYLDVHNAIMESQNKYQIIKEHGTVEYAQNEFYQESVLAGVLIGLGVIGLIASTILIIKKVNETSGKGSGKSSKESPSGDVNLLDQKSVASEHAKFKAKFEELVKKAKELGVTEPERKIIEALNLKRAINVEAYNKNAEALEKFINNIGQFLELDMDSDEYQSKAESLIQEIQTNYESIKNFVEAEVETIDVTGSPEEIIDKIYKSFEAIENAAPKFKAFDEALDKVKKKADEIKNKAAAAGNKAQSGENAESANKTDYTAIQNKLNSVLNNIGKAVTATYEKARTGFINDTKGIYSFDVNSLKSSAQSTNTAFKNWAEKYKKELELDSEDFKNIDEAAEHYTEFIERVKNNDPEAINKLKSIYSQAPEKAQMMDELLKIMGVNPASIKATNTSDEKVTNTQAETLENETAQKIIDNMGDPEWDNYPGNYHHYTSGHIDLKFSEDELKEQLGKPDGIKNLISTRVVKELSKPKNKGSELEDYDVDMIIDYLVRTGEEMGYKPNKPSVDDIKPILQKFMKSEEKENTEKLNNTIDYSAPIPKKCLEELQQVGLTEGDAKSIIEECYDKAKKPGMVKTEMVWSYARLIAPHVNVKDLLARENLSNLTTAFNVINMLCRYSNLGPLNEDRYVDLFRSELQSAQSIENNESETKETPESKENYINRVQGRLSDIIERNPGAFNFALSNPGQIDAPVVLKAIARLDEDTQNNILNMPEDQFINKLNETYQSLKDHKHFYNGFSTDIEDMVQHILVYKKNVYNGTEFTPDNVKQFVNVIYEKGSDKIQSLAIRTITEYIDKNDVNTAVILYQIYDEIITVNNLDANIDTPKIKNFIQQFIQKKDAEELERDLRMINMGRIERQLAEQKAAKKRKEDENNKRLNDMKTLISKFDVSQDVLSNDMKSFADANSDPNKDLKKVVNDRIASYITEHTPENADAAKKNQIKVKATNYVGGVLGVIGIDQSIITPNKNELQIEHAKELMRTTTDSSVFKTQKQILQYAKVPQEEIDEIEKNSAFANTYMIQGEVPFIPKEDSSDKKSNNGEVKPYEFPTTTSEEVSRSKAKNQNKGIITPEDASNMDIQKVVWPGQRVKADTSTDVNSDSQPVENTSENTPESQSETTINDKIKALVDPKNGVTENSLDYLYNGIKDGSIDRDKAVNLLSNFADDEIAEKTVDQLINIATENTESVNKADSETNAEKQVPTVEDNETTKSETNEPIVPLENTNTDNDEAIVPPITVTHNQTPETSSVQQAATPTPENGESTVDASTILNMDRDELINQLSSKYNTNPTNIEDAIESVRNGKITQDALDAASIEHPELADYYKTISIMASDEQPAPVNTQQAAATPTPTEEPKKKGFFNTLKETAGNVGKAVKSIITKESYEEYILPSGEMTMVLVEYEVTEYEDGSTEKRRIRIINE